MSAPLLWLLGALVLLVVVTTTMASARVDARDIAWLAGRRPPADEAAVYRRYLARHRSHRVVGAWFGVALAVVWGLTYQHQVNLGIGNGSPLGDVLFCGVAGMMLGALSAETYRLAEPRTDHAFASLLGHPTSPPGAAVGTARCLAGAAVLVGVVVLAATGSPASLVVALTGTVLVGIGEAIRAAVIGRRRPLLSTAAAEVDLRIRSYAWGAAGHLEVAAAALAAGWAVSRIPSDRFGWLQLLAVVGLLLLTLVALHRARPRPPRTFRVSTVRRPLAS
ncbi:MAG: hypothetical protein KDC36_05385 [Thermoleophilia bacterium]|nr:hypothetical protein [Thermoleophilia bacterium]